MGITLPLMPLQAVLCWLAPSVARQLACTYHRAICRLLGLRIAVTGTVPPGPVLLVANHVSWLDIPLLGSLAPLTFVAKSEVAAWPFIGTLARLQGCVFVDRGARQSAREQAATITARLAAGERVVLFAEGTSSDGIRVLPFRSALFAAVAGSAIPVQTVALAYTRLHGVPLSRADRPHVAWYGAMDVPGHAWTLLGLGPLDAALTIGPPLPEGAGRKDLARLAHAATAEDLRAMHRPARDSR
jgi:lyso-ornithine lipid O-acyltransferase